MAAMATNTKISLHSRSKSEPSVPHALKLQFDENLQRLKSSEPSYSSSSICSQDLNILQDLQDCIDKMLQLPTTRQALARECCENLADELLEEGSLRLLDISSTAKEALLDSKESIKELQSAIRRRRGSELLVPIEKFLSSRRQAKKGIRVTLENLKGNMKDLSLTYLDKEYDESLSMIRNLKEAEVITLSHLQSLLSFIYGSIGQSRHSTWSIVSKFMQPKRVACDSERANTNEFGNLDTTLQSLLRHKPCCVVPIENFHSHLENLKLCIQDLEAGIENLQRGLIRIRVSLLNIFNH